MGEFFDHLENDILQTCGSIEANIRMAGRIWEPITFPIRYYISIRLLVIREVAPHSGETTIMARTYSDWALVVAAFGLLAFILMSPTGSFVQRSAHAMQVDTAASVVQSEAPGPLAGLSPAPME